jgi:Fic family protein
VAFLNGAFTIRAKKMPRKISHSRVYSVIKAAECFPFGASIKDILTIPMMRGTPKRTLQRDLDRLVQAGHLKLKGKGRATRYVIPFEEEGSTSILREEPDSFTGDTPWLSPEGRRIRYLVQRPRTERIPVGYKSDFLDAYQPNRTFYLPAETRDELARFGYVGADELPPGTYLRQVLQRLLIDLSWNSSRLEGNTYSLLETERLLHLGEAAEGHKSEETQMILNHKAALEMLSDNPTGVGFNSHTVCNLHALLADNLLHDPASCGRVRSRPVGISGTVFHPLAVPQLIEEKFEQILWVANEIENPYEQAFFVMVHLPYLQPFEDVNKRVSRLAANIPMIRHNLCPLSFTGVEQKDYIGGLLGVYELNCIEYLRDVFVWAYKSSANQYIGVKETLGSPDPFRLKYRSEITRFVSEIARKQMNRLLSLEWTIAEAGRSLPKDDRERFQEVIRIELEGLHSGNIARHRLRLSEFEAWKNNWK